MAEGKKPYPASLSVDYPDRELNRLTSFFRIIVIIPIGILLCLVSGAVFSGDEDHALVGMFSAGGVLFLATVLMLVFRQKYPLWWFDWNLALTRFGTLQRSQRCIHRWHIASNHARCYLHLF